MTIDDLLCFWKTIALIDNEKRKLNPMNDKHQQDYECKATFAYNHKCSLCNGYDFQCKNYITGYSFKK